MTLFHTQGSELGGGASGMGDIGVRPSVKMSALCFILEPLSDDSGKHEDPSMLFTVWSKKTDTVA